MIKQLQNLIIKINELRGNFTYPPTTEEDFEENGFNKGVTAARDLVIKELGRINCPICRRKENTK